MARSPEAAARGVPPCWMGVVCVTDAAGAAARCLELGGQVHVPAFPIPNVGTYAVLADPTGAAFAVLQPAGPDEEPPSRTEAGRVCWDELWTSDATAAMAFYEAMFGWSESGSMDMGPAGIYRMYGPKGGVTLGGVAPKMPEQPVSAWSCYFVVPEITAAAARVAELGGKVFMGPHDVPGGRILMAFDPQGAVFALYANAT